MNWRFLIGMMIVVTMFTTQNNYFGWHLLPHSDAELVTDHFRSIMEIMVLMLWKDQKE